MTEFLDLLPPEVALARLLSHLPVQQPPLNPTWVEDCISDQALGRVTAEPVFAPHPLPTFPRSAVDGYAVRAADTYGASEGLPAYLNVMGEIPMGAVPKFDVKTGQCALIHTGGMLPEGANAVVMVEYTQNVRSAHQESTEDNLQSRYIKTGEEVLHPVAVGENMLVMGEDVATGQEVIPAGKRLRPADIGGLMALGITHLPVVRKPRVAILSSGDEVVSSQVDLKPGQVRDVNSYTLKALVEEAGGEPVLYGIIPDRPEILKATAERALTECDLLAVTAGSSASSRDLTSVVINKLGSPGVLVHGVNIRPGKPTILAVCNGKPAFGLPGNPVSALVIAKLFVVPVIQSLLGISRPKFQPSILARLTINVASQAGREDWIPVRLSLDEDGYLAEPVFGKSNLIFTLSRADGLVRISSDATGLNGGEIVSVVLL